MEQIDLDAMCAAMQTSKQADVVTRFAPSPTGYLHIGSARTAYFNWALARKAGGKFILRIDDTDTKRHVENSIQSIFDGLNWLGITPDEGPYYQSQRIDIYRAAAMRLIESGYAYPCISRPESELEEIISKENPQTSYGPVFRGELRNQNPIVSQVLTREEKLPLRFRIPDEKVRINDAIRGSVYWEAKNYSDPIIMRADGTPTYNFATAVDDVDMGITHVVRGEEHLDNTAIQMWIMNALSKTDKTQKPRPTYAHLPVVNAPNSNKKLSKRNRSDLSDVGQINVLHRMGFSYERITEDAQLNPVSVDYYRFLGFPPKAMCNYLSRLGWSLDGNTEIFDQKTFLEKFDLRSISKGPAQFTPHKLNWLAMEYIKKDTIEERAMAALPLLRQAGIMMENMGLESLAYYMKIIELCSSRFMIYSDIVKFAYFFAKPIYDIAAVSKCINSPNLGKMLDMYRRAAERVDNWEDKPLETHLTEWCADVAMDKKSMSQAIRVAITGTENGISLYKTMEVLGKDECLERIKDKTNVS